MFIYIHMHTIILIFNLSGNFVIQKWIGTFGGINIWMILNWIMISKNKHSCIHLYFVWQEYLNEEKLTRHLSD